MENELFRKRVRWHARRGLLELDLLLATFLDNKLDQLDQVLLEDFYELLLLPDSILLDVLNGKMPVNDPSLQRIVQLIHEVVK